MIILVMVIIALIIYIIADKYLNNYIKNKAAEDTAKKLPYKKKLLLTKYEWGFYKELKPIADELGYTVLAKIRVADLIEVTAKDHSEWQKYFNKISNKHIDFVLAKPENLQVILLIELDDNSHNKTQKKRDDFINALYQKADYKLLRVNGTAELKSKIESTLQKDKLLS